jgi:hypothetical protein
MSETQIFRRVSYSLGLFRIERQRFSGGDGTEGTVAGAEISQDHEGGRTAGKTLSLVGTAGLFTDRVEPVFPE